MMHRPVFKPHYLVKVIENEGVFLLSERHQTVLQGWLYEVIAPRLDGRPVEDLCAELRGRVMPAQVYYTLNQLEKKGYIAEGGGDAATMPPGEAALWSMLRVDPGEAAGRLARSTVALTVFGDVDIEPFRALLGALRVRVAEAGSEEVGLGVVVTDHYLRDGLQPYNKEALRTGRPWLLIKPVGTMVWIGPLFRPGITGCWECLAERIRANFPILGYLDGKRALNSAPGADRGGTSATEAVAWGLAANAVASWIAQGESPQLEGRVQTFDVLGWRGESHALVRAPDLPVVRHRPTRGRSARSGAGTPAGRPTDQPQEGVHQRWWASGGATARDPPALRPPRQPDLRRGAHDGAGSAQQRRRSDARVRLGAQHRPRAADLDGPPVGPPQLELRQGDERGAGSRQHPVRGNRALLGDLPR